MKEQPLNLNLGYSIMFVIPCLDGWMIISLVDHYLIAQY